MRSTPEDGDVVVQRDKKDGTPVYVLHTAPGPDQLVFHSREDAVRQATVAAKHRRVRVWLADGSVEFRLLEDFRPVGAVGD